MDLRHGPAARRASAWATLAITLSLGPLGTRAADGPAPGLLDLPPGLQIDVDGTIRQEASGDLTIEGPVTITWEGSRIQADRVTLRERRFVTASGNVLIVWGGNRLYGSSLEYDLETEKGTVHDALASVLDQYLISAKVAHKIGDRKLRIHDASVTTCTQPLPYWSFRVSRATITIDGYARMTNVRLRAAKMPVIYLPFLVWPVKEDRAAGLLMPELSSTDSRGDVYSQELFIPLGRSADVTLLGRWFTEAGFGGGGTARFIPNQHGRGEIRSFFIDDSIYAPTNDGDGRRYSVTYLQDQSFQNGFRMVADVNAISDDQYYSDYERDLNLASSPDTKARLDFSRNGAWTSLNVREYRREQLSSGLVQSTLPEIEWRGRSTKLGPTPVYLAFASSIASIRQEASDVDADYWRGDLFPELSLPWSPVPWFDITPRVSHRWTRWTQQQRITGSARTVLDDDLNRSLWAYGLSLVGPKLFRIFGAGEGGRPSFKHSIEPRVGYGFAEVFDREDDVIRYDEVDTAGGSDRQLAYALVQRLFVKRPRAEAEPTAREVSSVVLPDGALVDPAPRPEPDPAGQPQEPVEIASLQLAQSRSFDRVRTADTDGDQLIDASTPFSDLALTGRYNPNPNLSVDLGATWSVLFDSVSTSSLSGGWRDRVSTLRLSAVRTEGLGTTGSDDLQMRYFAGFSLLPERTLNTDRLQFSISGSYLSRLQGELSHFPEQRWTLRYGSQCCTVFVERLTRDIDDRREIHVRLDLTGVGKILSSTF